MLKSDYLEITCKQQGHFVSVSWKHRLTTLALVRSLYDATVTSKCNNNTWTVILYSCYGDMWIYLIISTSSLQVASVNGNVAMTRSTCDTCSLWCKRNRSWSML